MRRFELIQGNQAKFWEVQRKGEVILTSWGRIGGASTSKTKEYDDFMAAEQEFDRLIRDKLRAEYVEVHEESEAPNPIPARALRLEPVNGGEALDLPGEATRYLVWRMIEVEVADRFAPAPDLERWNYRVARRLRLEEPPTPDSDQYDAWLEEWLRLSEAERKATTGNFAMGAYKFMEGHHWVVVPEECSNVATNLSGAAPRRHKPTVQQTRWNRAFTDFNHACAQSGGYVVVPVEE